MRTPLAVRSSSLLEDTQFHPFAGIYQTYMIPNSDPDPAVRLRELLTAIKRVYGSTFYRAASEYIKVTSLRPEDEKMAELYRQHVLKEQPTIKIAGLGGKKKPVAEVLHDKAE